MLKGNIIDISKRRRAEKGTKTKNNKKAEVLDITERRAEIINQERREVKRTILTEFIGACAVVPQKGLLKVSLYDISDNGIAFDMASDEGHFKSGEEVAMRVYLNQFTYFPFVVKINNSRYIENEGVTRHGTSFIKGTINDLALQHFIKFIETISASLERDTGDVMVSNLNR